MFALDPRAGELIAWRGVASGAVVLRVRADKVVAISRPLRVVAPPTFFTGVRILERGVLIDLVGEERGVREDEKPSSRSDTDKYDSESRLFLPVDLLGRELEGAGGAATGFVVVLGTGRRADPDLVLLVLPLDLELPLLPPYFTLTLLLSLPRIGSPKCSASELAIGELSSWIEKLALALLAAPRRGMTTSTSRGDREGLGVPMSCNLMQAISDEPISILIV